MPKPATELMQEILFSVFLDSIDALKSASNGLPNQLVRDMNAIHRNVTFADLPKEVQDAINSNVRLAFTRLLKEGYAVAPSAPGRSASPAGSTGAAPQQRRTSGPRSPRPPASRDRPNGNNDGPRRGPRPGGKPRG